MLIRPPNSDIYNGNETYGSHYMCILPYHIINYATESSVNLLMDIFENLSYSRVEDKRFHS